METDAMQGLHKSLSERWRPEDVADLVLDVLVQQLTPAEQQTIDKAARGALRRHKASHQQGWSSMRNTYARPEGPKRQLTVASHIFSRRSPGAEDLAGIERFVAELSREIHKEVGLGDFKRDRLSRGQRKAAGLTLSRRQYNKKFRLLTRMEAKWQKLTTELRKFRLRQAGKSGFASGIDWQDFASDHNTACFVAYYTARCNLRSEFTIYGQTKPFDEVAEVLYRRCQHGPTTHWGVIASVFTDMEVLQKLDDERKGQLLGRWFSLLEDAGTLLEMAWSRAHFRRDTMIVKRGDDSSTWNLAAKAWNKARSGWIALLYAMGMDGLLDERCPGKVLALMAADVAAWHRMEGGDLHPDTPIWAELPLPWEVMAGKQACNRSQVEEACRRHGVDPHKKGWTAPRPKGEAVRFAPTPELVHGVTVSSPAMAYWLRQIGAYSAKGVKLVAGEMRQ